MKIQQKAFIINGTLLFNQTFYFANKYQTLI